MRYPRCPATLAAMAAAATIGFTAYGDSASAQTDAKSNPPNAITVSGCVRSADQMTVGTSGSAGTSGSTRSASESSTKFILTNVTPASSSGEAVATGRTKKGSSASGYRLDADEGKLTPHVGHKVEISGTIENPGSTSPVSDSVFSSAPRVKVTSIRALASTCGQ